jgi:hypothetical protein
MRDISISLLILDSFGDIYFKLRAFLIVRVLVITSFSTPGER